MANDTHATGVRIRPTNADEFAAYARVGERSFGEEPSADTIALWRALVDYERMLAAVDDAGAIVATAGAMTFDMTVPGGRRLGCAGVTAVTVRQDHRRQGLLRSMMRSILDDARARGEPLAALWASEAPIYGRFGFGPGVPLVDLDVSLAHAHLRRTPALLGEVRLEDTEHAARLCAGIYDAARDVRGGMLSRGDAVWRRVAVFDPVGERAGAGPRELALVEGRGYALYRLRPSWQGPLAQGTVVVEELVATDAEAEHALWGFLLASDLAERLVASGRPVDEVLPLLLHDAPRARVSSGAALYVRLLDVAEALSARRYAVDDTLVVEVIDVELPDQQGRFVVEAAGGVGVCDRTSRAPDLTCDADVLATFAMGGVRPSTLARAGRIDARDAAVLERADLLFSTTPAPWTTGEF